EAAVAGLEDRRPAEQAEGLAVEALAAEGEGRGHREGVKAEDLAGPQLVEGEGRGGRGGAGEGDLTQGEQALELAGAAGRAVGGQHAGGDPGGSKREVEVVVRRQWGRVVAESTQGGDKIVAT